MTNETASVNPTSYVHFAEQMAEQAFRRYGKNLDLGTLLEDLEPLLRERDAAVKSSCRGEASTPLLQVHADLTATLQGIRVERYGANAPMHLSAYDSDIIATALAASGWRKEAQ